MNGLVGQLAIVGEAHGIAHAIVDDAGHSLFVSIGEDVCKGLQRIVELQSCAVSLDFRIDGTHDNVCIRCHTLVAFGGLRIPVTVLHLGACGNTCHVCAMTQGRGIAAVHGCGDGRCGGVLLVFHIVGSPLDTCRAAIVAEERMDVVEASIYNAYDDAFACVVGRQLIAGALMYLVSLNLTRHDVHHGAWGALCLYAHYCRVFSHGRDIGQGDADDEYATNAVGDLKAIFGCKCLFVSLFCQLGQYADRLIAGSGTPVGREVASHNLTEVG